MPGTHGVFTHHLPPAKDRSLAVTLLRMSERKGLQDDFILEAIVYCGDDEPFKGWTNTVPTARYSESNRPKDELPKRRKQSKPKAKQQLESKESMSDIYSEFLGITTRAEGHYHASATLQELYGEYKKRQRIEDNSKLKGMVDPVTFRYVPIDERADDVHSDDGSEVRLPVLKMTHANKQAKLLEVLENFMSRKNDDDKRTDTERFAVKARDAASFYDNYKWYFKDKQGRLTRNMKVKKRGKRLHGKRKGALGSRNYYSESESDDSDRRRRTRIHSHPPSYVIQVKDEKSKTLTEETITFERKTDYGLSAPGGPGIDRWVARVVIRDAPTPGENRSNSSTTTSQMNSKSSNAQIDTLHDLRTKNPQAVRQDGQKQPDYRLANRKNRKRQSRKLPASFYDMYHISAVETAKVSMKYNVPIGKVRSRVLEGSESSSGDPGATNKETAQVSKKKKVRPTPVHPRKHIDSINNLEPSTQRVVPLYKGPENSETTPEDSKLPLPPIKSKKSSPLSFEDSSSKISKVRKKFRSTDADRKANKDEKSIFALQQMLESSEERQIKTPSCSTFNPDRMFQQMKDTADFITKAPMLPSHSKSIHSPPRFLSHIEDARGGDGNGSIKSEPPRRKPLHPKHQKNRAQDKLQQIIDEEKALVSKVIKQMNANWKEKDREKLAPVPESIQDALSTAIAKARLHDMQNDGTISTARRSSVNQVMKRRVVPPVKEKSSVPTTTVVGSTENFFLTDSTSFLTTKPKLPSVKGNNGGTKISSKAARSLSKDRNEAFKVNNKLQPGIRFVPDGDFVIAKSQSITPKVSDAVRNAVENIDCHQPVRRIFEQNSRCQRMNPNSQFGGMPIPPD